MRAAIFATVAIVACNRGGGPQPVAGGSAPPSNAAPFLEKPAAPAPSVSGPNGSRVETRTFHSDALGVDKSVVVYLPAGYDGGTKRYPVFFYLHGLGGSERNWLEMGRMDLAADELGLQAIVVMPDGDNNFYFDSKMKIDYEACMASGKGLFSARQDHAQTCVHASKYDAYITHDLVGWVDSVFRTIPKREARGIAGLSMGGFGALQLGMRHPDVFAAAASHSGVDTLLVKGPIPYPAGHPEKAELYTDVTKWGQVAGGQDLGAFGEWFQKLFGPNIEDWKAVDPAFLAQKLEPGKLALYIDCGTEDDFALQHSATYLHDVLAARGIEHEFFLGPGAHNFGFWRPRLPFSLKFLRAHTAPAL